MAKQGHRFQPTCDPLGPSLEPSRRQTQQTTRSSVDTWLDTVTPNDLRHPQTSSTAATVATSSAHPRNSKSVESGNSNAATRGSVETATTNSSRRISHNHHKTAPMLRKEAAEPSVINTAVETVKEKIKRFIPAGGVFMAAEPEKLGNGYSGDAGLRRALEFHLPSFIASDPAFVKELVEFAEVVMGPQIGEWVEDVERNGKSDGWGKLREFGTREGLIATGYETKYGIYSRVAQFAKLFLFAPTSTSVTVPFATTDAVAALLRDHMQQAVPGRKAFAKAFSHLTSRSDSPDTPQSWTCAQLPDPSTSEATAKYNPSSSGNTLLGPWEVSNVSYNPSMETADITPLFAFTPNSPDNLSTFYAPLQRPNSNLLADEAYEPNGTLSKRHKKLNNIRAHLLGREATAHQTLAALTTLHSLHHTTHLTSLLSRTLLLTKHLSLQTPLHTNPQHLHLLATISTQARALTNLALFLTSLLSLAEAGPEHHHAHPSLFIASPEPLLRILTPLARAMATRIAKEGIQELVSSVAGVQDEAVKIQLDRLLRDVNALTADEDGSSAKELVRALVGGKHRTTGVAVLADWVESNLAVPIPGAPAASVRNEAREVLEKCKLETWKQWEEVQRRLESWGREETGGMVRWARE
ncbi:hypothetical protein BJ508DRAFT_373894 [Ascobolus immersus RN42]|uniref:Uncharacterized protein n=1 Tax=Ascobolus immersus RN42 TaxID=1160509 RepID=A0A3N4IH99_ASCIM|nr:hypothetical protein BJ508DRAFT_373894 [Ascobolus immersus RN42]